MITSFMAANALHAAYVIRQKGLTKILAIGFCSIEEDAGPGVYQVPDWVFDGRAKYVDTPVCAKCAAAVASKKEPPR